jgi:hypothetical protein
LSHRELFNEALCSPEGAVNGAMEVTTRLISESTGPEFLEFLASETTAYEKDVNAIFAFYDRIGLAL